MHVNKPAVYWTSRFVGYVLILAALGLMAHWYIHPEHPHPPAWLIAAFFGVGVVASMPEVAESTCKHLMHLGPWRKP